MKTNICSSPDILVAPVLEAEACSRKFIYQSTPPGKMPGLAQQYEGGQWIDVPAPIETIPLFLKASSHFA